MELALHALNSIDEASSAGLVPAGDGFLVPIRTRVERCLLRLPPEGREAYRLFNDANARQLWGHLQDAHGIPSDELQTLRKLVERYFLTSVGDLAADRLGDALFEQGDFSGAGDFGGWLSKNIPTAIYRSRNCNSSDVLPYRSLAAATPFRPSSPIRRNTPIKR